MLIFAAGVGSQSNQSLTIELATLLDCGWKGVDPGFVGSQESHQLLFFGEMAEWLNAAVLKTVLVKANGGSNPSLSAFYFNWLIFIIKKSIIMKNLTKEQFLGIVRHTLTFVGGILLTQGIIDASLLGEVAGAVVTLAGAIWSLVSKK